MAIPISLGGGAASIASEKVGNNDYQQIKIIGGETGSTSVMSVAPDGAILASVIGTPNVRVNGSVLAMQLAGSVMAVSYTASANQSVSGAVTAPAGSVMTVAQLAGSVMAVSYTASANQSVSGAVTAPAGSVMTVATLAGSIMAVSGATTTTAGSVIAARTDNASVITVWQNSSVIAVLSAPSIVGTYAEDAAHTTAEKGIFTLGVRNDLMASVTGADGDYSQVAVGPVGETLTANAPITKWVRGNTDHRVTLGASLISIAAQGASVFTYITSAQISNMGPSSVLVTIGGGLGSTLGWTIAPAGGGSNIYMPNAYKTGENSAVTTSISGTASVLVSLQGFTAKA